MGETLDYLENSDWGTDYEGLAEEFYSDDKKKRRDKSVNDKK